MSESPVLELTVQKHYLQNYSVELHFSANDPGEAEDVSLGPKKSASATFHLNQLDMLRFTGDIPAYGRCLSESLFADVELRAKFASARAVAESSGTPLRFRLNIHPTAIELNSLYWETLIDPERGISLSTDQNIYFSRYLSSPDWHRFRLRARGTLKTLIMIAAPDGLADYHLSPIDKQAELEPLQNSLEGMPFEVLRRADLDSLFSELTRTEYDILYIVAHGEFDNREEAFLCLEDEQGKPAFIPAYKLVTRLRELDHRPRLVILISCQSAGKGKGDVLSALGPQLAEAGVPAVLAMQADFRKDTSACFMKCFLNELLKQNGQVDRALMRARGLVKDFPDWWVPVLYMRLRDGRLWYKPGFADSKATFQKFPSLIQNINDNHLTPILGPGLLEPLFGSQREIALSWAGSYNYPMFPHERESLPQVAQFLAIDQQKVFPYKGLENHLRERLQSLYAAQLPPDLMKGSAEIGKILNEVGRLLRASNPAEPHRALAELPIKMYMTTNYDTILESALKEAGRDPQIRVCPWNDVTFLREGPIYDEETYTVEKPLVYHLFGLWDDQETIVLTEDNYFEFLLGIAQNKTLIPKMASLAMAQNGLLFLGFQTNEWQFRVLFRAILSLMPSTRRNRFVSVAAQIEPEDGAILNPKHARDYLEKYFTKGHNIDLSIFWGTPDEFIVDLMGQWREKA